MNGFDVCFVGFVDSLLVSIEKDILFNIFVEYMWEKIDSESLDFSVLYIINIMKMFEEFFNGNVELNMVFINDLCLVDNVIDVVYVIFNVDMSENKWL